MGEDPHLALTGGVLRAVLKQNPRRLEGIAAQQDVSVDYAGFQAAGQDAVYSADTGRVRVSGEPSWRAQQQEGKADELILQWTNRVLEANGHGQLKMPGQGLGLAGLSSGGGSAWTPSATKPPAPAARDQVLEVLSESYTVWTNRAEFRDRVQVTQRADGQVQGTMSCGLLAVAFKETNQLDRLTAQRQVVLRQQQWQFTADTAVYEGASGVMELTGEPKWQAGERAGRGDVITLSSKPEGMQVRGNAFMRMPAEQFAQAVAVNRRGPGRAAAALSGAAKPPAQAPRQPALSTPAATNQPFADIRAQQYSVTPEGAIFEGQVSVTHPQMHWTCQRLEVEWLDSGMRRRVLAEGGVRFEVIGAGEQRLLGDGDRADYTFWVAEGATNELMVLYGNPARLRVRAAALDSKQGAPAQERGTLETPVITLDRVHSRIITSTNYAIQIAAQPMNTNAFRLPKNKLFR